MVSIRAALEYCFFPLRQRTDAEDSFIFDLIRHVLRDKRSYDAYGIMEDTRRAFLRSKEKIRVLDLGAGSGGKRKTKNLRKISRIARVSAGKPRYHRLLYRMTRHYQPAVMLEAGTSLGLGTLALALGNPAGQVFTVEGDPASASQARSMFRQRDLSNITLLTGSFREMFPQVFAQADRLDFIFLDGHHEEKATLEYFEMLLPHIHEKSILVADDIRWSKGMNRAWQALQQHPRTCLCVDIFQMGILFFDPSRPKQTLRIRY